MSSEFYRQYLDLLDSIEHDDVDVQEADHTDEIEFDESDSFEEVIQKIVKDDRNRIGTGGNRETWHHPFDKRLVIKVAKCREDKKVRTYEECALRNVWEYLVWHKVNSENLPEKEHLMPCMDIHPKGEWLTMFKGERLPTDSSVDIKGDMEWVGDRSKDNFRVKDGNTYIIDYGTEKAMQHLDLPIDLNSGIALLARILKSENKPVNHPNYGKSTPHPDPFETRD